MFPQAILKHLLIKKTRQLASFDKAKTEASYYSDTIAIPELAPILVAPALIIAKASSFE